MSSDRDTTRIVRSWLEEGVTQLPDRVLDGVLDQIPSTRQRRRPWSVARRTSLVNNMMRFALAGAAVVAIVFATTLLVTSNVLGPGAATPTNTPTPEAQAQSLPKGRITPMTARYAVQLPHAPLDAIITIGQGWTSGGWFVRRGDAAVLFYSPENVNADACRQDATLPDPPIGPTVDDFLSALGAQRNSDMTAPVDEVIGGMTAKRIELRASAGAPCSTLLWWTDPCCGDPAFRGSDRASAQSRPDTVWVFDVEGRRLAVVGYWDHADNAMGQAISNMVRSLEFVSR
jgi:hypothetical protein